MAKMRKVHGYKFGRSNDAVDWVLRHEHKVVPHQIAGIETVSTPDGPMLLVRLRQHVEFSNPNVDVAVLVGNIAVKTRLDKQNPQAPELWFYADKFWVKGRDGGGAEYYNGHRYLLYEVKVNNEAALWQATQA